MSLERRLSSVRARIAAACERAGRDPRAIQLVAVSKTQPAEAVIAAWECGLTDFGENRVQEALAKMPAVLTRAPGARFHLIGHLQANKARAAADAFVMLHSVDSERLLRRLEMVATRPLPVMLEVNVSGEGSKFGVAPGELGALVALARSLRPIVLEGLMTVAPLAPDPEAVRPVFARLRQLASAEGLPSLSMGMTDDFEVAIEEGATHVRIGRAIFGERTG